MDSNEIYSEIIKNNLKEKRYYQNMLVRASWGSPASGTGGNRGQD